MSRVRRDEAKVASQTSESEGRSRWFTEKSLEESRRVGECLICSNLVYSERHAIYSFLWEGMMSSIVRDQFLRGDGFCSRHFWIAKQIEEDCWPAGGIGVAILCENLVSRALRVLPTAQTNSPAGQRTMFRLKKREARSSRPGDRCMFCADWQEREEALIETLETLRNRPEWSDRLTESPSHGVSHYRRDPLAGDRPEPSGRAAECSRRKGRLT
jgi:hypothetical protein